MQTVLQYSFSWSSQWLTVRPHSFYHGGTSRSTWLLRALTICTGWAITPYLISISLLCVLVIHSEVCFELCSSNTGLSTANLRISRWFVAMWVGRSCEESSYLSEHAAVLLLIVWSDLVHLNEGICSNRGTFFCSRLCLIWWSAKHH